jgi:hypothetical protein
VVIVVIKIECILGELGEIPYEPMKEEHDGIMSEESTANHQLHVLNETSINFFGNRTDGKVGLSSTIYVNTNNCCQLCR